MRLWPCRRLLPDEHAFIERHFGASLQAVQPRLRLHLRRLGDTRRAWSLNGGHLALARMAFVEGDLQQPLRLADAAVAGVFAHELLHQWQRLQGLAVTRQAAWLQALWLVRRCDPYAYAACADPDDMLARFLVAQVEQQAQMWQDHVQACVAGCPDPAYARIAQWVRGGGAVLPRPLDRLA